MKLSESKINKLLKGTDLTLEDLKIYDFSKKVPPQIFAEILKTLKCTPRDILE